MYVFSYKIYILVFYVPTGMPFFRLTTLHSGYLVSLILIYYVVYMIEFCASKTSSRTERALSGRSCQPKLLKLVCCLHTRVSLLLLKGPSSQISLQILAKNCLPFLLSCVHLLIICLTCFANITFITLLNAFLRYLFIYNS